MTNEYNAEACRLKHAATDAAIAEIKAHNALQERHAQEMLQLLRGPVNDPDRGGMASQVRKNTDAIYRIEAYIHSIKGGIWQLVLRFATPILAGVIGALGVKIL